MGDEFENPFQAYLVASFLVGLLLVAKSLIQLVIGNLSRPRWLEVVSGLGALFLACILTTDLLAFVASSDDSSFLWPGLLSAALSCLFLATHIRVSALQLARVTLLRHPAAWLALAMSCGAAGWSSHRYYEGLLRGEMESIKYYTGSGTLQAVSERVALTDRGREVQLFVYAQEESPAKDRVASSPFGLWRDSDAESNCHGWVFTGGRNLLWRDGVEMILEDNGYEPCQQPRAGDLIIYRNEEGEPIHTGIVHSIGWNGTVKIESKWGIRGRFVHAVQTQPYGGKYIYYRSQRNGHVVTIRDTHAPATADAGQMRPPQVRRVEQPRQDPLTAGRS
jgi:hypothetical protein